ncbi:MAG: transglutaminase domain-containing protein [bacterium]|nr:transglutaminase domain-containing protein [bacterium]
MYYLTPRAIVTASIIALLGALPYPSQAQAPAVTPTPASGTSTVPGNSGGNPWDKYGAPESSKQTKAAPAPAPAGSNPWDKYDTSAIKNSVPKTSPSGQASHAANPWDKYITDKVPMVPFAPNTPSQINAGEGSNPWDKYTPASMPQVTPKHSRNQEQPKVLELAPPMPERKIPEGSNKVYSELPIGKPYHYAIEYNDQLIGYSEFSVSNKIVLDGRTSYLLNSSSRVKVGTDSISDLRYFSKMQVNKRDLTPTSLICSQKSNADDYRITCIYSPNIVAQSNTTADKTNSRIHTLKKETANLIFNNLWGQLDTFAEHYWLLAMSAIKGGQVEVYDPILRTDGKVTVYAPVQEKWSANGRDYASMLYTISDLYGSPLAQVRLDAKTKELLEIKEIGSGIHFRLSNAGVVKAVDKAAGVNMWPSKVRISNIYFSDPNKLTHLEAGLEMSLRGGQLAQHSITGYEQKMYGQVKEGQLVGRVVVDVKPAKIKQNLSFPIEEAIPDNLAPYLEFDAHSEADNPIILNKANEITWKAGTVYQAARRLTGFIANDIENGISLPSAVQTLEHSIGNPESKALLLVAMARSVGIPARTVGGLVYQRGEFAPHYWAELWMGPEAQWMAFDPSTNEAGSVNASHIALWQSGDVQNLQIEVEKFAPHPQRQVPFFSKQLKWSVGEKRTFAIVSEGKRIGTETAHLQDLQLIDNRESYSFHAETAMFDRPQELPALSAPAEEKTAASAPDSAENSESSASSQENKAENTGGESVSSDGAKTAAPATPSAPAAAEAKKDADTSAAPAQPSSPNSDAAGKKPDNAVPTAAPTPIAGAKRPDSQGEQAVPPTVVQTTPEAALTAETMKKAAAENKANATDTNDAAAPAAGEETAAVPPETVSVEPPTVTAVSICDNLYNTYGLPQSSIIKVKKDPNAEPQEVRLRFSNNRVYEQMQVNGQEVEREVPVSNGLYLADQRFLSQWVLAIEQIPTDEEQEGQEAGTYSIHIFVPELLSSQELLLTEDEEQSEITRLDGTKVQTTCLRSEKGMEFYLDDKHQVVKIAVPNRKIELYLEKSEFSLE